jgi:hypothetical protein
MDFYYLLTILQASGGCCGQSVRSSSHFCVTSLNLYLLHLLGSGGHAKGSGTHCPAWHMPPLQGAPSGFGNVSLHWPVHGLHLYCRRHKEQALREVMRK